MTGRDSYIDEDISLRDAIAPLMARWKLLLAVSILGAIATFAYVKSKPRLYKGTASIFVQQNSKGMGLLRDMPIQLGSAGGGTSGYLSALLQSETLLRSVALRLDLASNRDFAPRAPARMDDVVDALKLSVAVREEKSGGIGITVGARSPYLAARIANCMLDKLSTLVVTVSKRKSVFIDKKLGDTGRDLQQAEDQLLAFLERNDIAQIDEQTKGMIQQLGELDVRLLSLDVDLEDVKSRLVNAGELDTLVDFEVRRKALESSRNYVIEKRAEMQGKLTGVPAVAMDYARLQRRVGVLSKTFELLTEQFQLAQITQQGEDADYQIIDRARPDLKPISSHTLLKTAGGGLLGFVIAAFVASLMPPPAKRKDRKGSRAARETDETPTSTGATPHV